MSLAKRPSRAEPESTQSPDKAPKAIANTIGRSGAGSSLNIGKSPAAYNWTRTPGSAKAWHIVGLFVFPHLCFGILDYLQGFSRLIIAGAAIGSQVVGILALEQGGQSGGLFYPPSKNPPRSSVIFICWSMGFDGCVGCGDICCINNEKSNAMTIRVNAIQVLKENAASLGMTLAEYAAHSEANDPTFYRWLASDAENVGDWGMGLAPADYH